MDTPLWKRASGVLLHPTSLPGPHGIGDLGESAYQFVDFLAAAGQSFWQLLPLGPPGYGHSPYQCLSSMAGNPLLLSLDTLAQEGWLSPADLQSRALWRDSFVDFGRMIPFKWRLLKKAAAAFAKNASPEQRSEFGKFCIEKRAWLEPYARFMALKEANEGLPWTEWAHRSDPDPAEMREHEFIQFEFFRQWRELKEYCNRCGIRIIGDLPIFVAPDSVDVWANPELFDLDAHGRPRVIAGVPPDYFSASGQLWGNPLYRWDVHEQTGYAWWIERVRTTLEMVDVIRLDHFRGFEKYYEIPAGAANAIEGRWVEGPGEKLFNALQSSLGALPVIAEDLGVITPEVEALRERFGFPGMRILQFAFSNECPEDIFKPYNHVKNCVVYTGTHDNDTVVGWFTSPGTGDSTRTADQVRAEREFALRYLNSDGGEIHWDFIRLALASVASTAIFPLQDVLGLGSEARMNLPASTGRNWTWRFQPKQLKPKLAERLRLLSGTYGRCRPSTEPHS
ncbi:MAG: 4-alpha-glucanotransferase [Acidobacteria bacterium]|nr:4-alpha-glucanotransferase [Acidobacteriota bacterium]